MTTFGLSLEPLDVLFFRDGRPFGASSRAGGGLPVPQTLFGALTTGLLEAAGCNFAELATLLNKGASLADAVDKAVGAEHRWIDRLAVRGPWLARIKQDSAGNAIEPEPLIPAPATLHALKGRHHSAGHRPGGAPDDQAAPPLLRALPLDARRPVPGWAHTPEGQAGLRPLWFRQPGAAEPAGGYLTFNGLKSFLHGESVSPAELLQPDSLYTTDERTGIGIDPDRLSAAESLIYGARFLSLRPPHAPVGECGNTFGVQLYAEVVLPDEANPDLLTRLSTLALGGEGRRVACRWLDKPVDWSARQPATQLQDGRRKPFYLLTTPGLFDAGWKPACLEGKLAAAAVPGTVAVSGWDMARNGPKPTRFAAQAGSVYFADSPIEPSQSSLCDNPLDQRHGWGCYLTGVWTDD